MKKKDKQALKEKDIKTLLKDVADRKKKLHALQSRISAGKEKNTRSAKILRHEISRILGIINAQVKKEETK
jgi:ribosomal protein L29